MSSLQSLLNPVPSSEHTSPALIVTLSPASLNDIQHKNIDVDYDVGNENGYRSSPTISNGVDADRGGGSFLYSRSTQHEQEYILPHASDTESEARGEEEQNDYEEDEEYEEEYDENTETDVPMTDGEGHPRSPQALNTPDQDEPDVVDMEFSQGEQTYITPPQRAAIVLTPSPPLGDIENHTIVIPSNPALMSSLEKAAKKKRRPTATKKRAPPKTSSKKRAPQDEGEYVLNEDGSISHLLPKKKPRKSNSAGAGGGAQGGDEGREADAIVVGGVGGRLQKRSEIKMNGRSNSQPKHDDQGRELYCTCREPDSGKWMIGCDGCEDWYHGECINVKEEDGELIDKYYCHNCSSPTQQTTWKRKCRLFHCRKPAAVNKSPPSKYCSTEHGIEFMRLQIERSTLTAGEISTLANSVSNVTEFKRLGDRIPTPPPASIAASAYFYPEEVKRLKEIVHERFILDTRQKRRIDFRRRYLALTQERRIRVLEELKADPEMGKLSTICGYDERLALDDFEWDEWCDGDEGAAIFSATADGDGIIPGRDGVCIKKACRAHRGWATLFADEQDSMERLRSERLVQLRQEDRRIRERQKRRAVKDSREGTVEIEE